MSNFLKNICKPKQYLVKGDLSIILTNINRSVDFDGLHEKFELKKSENVVMLICLGNYDTTKELYPRRTRRLFNEIASII